jgi:hypothetical protein
MSVAEQDMQAAAHAQLLAHHLLHHVSCCSQCHASLYVASMNKACDHPYLVTCGPICSTSCVTVDSTHQVLPCGSFNLVFGGGGRLLQVDTFTAERYSPHGMNWEDTPARKTCSKTGKQDQPPKKHTPPRATATHTRYRIVHS